MNITMLAALLNNSKYSSLHIASWLYIMNELHQLIMHDVDYIQFPHVYVSSVSW